MQRLSLLCVLTAMLALAFAGAARAEEQEPLCQARPFMCQDPMDSIGEYGEYTGHDEPSVIFGSHKPGSGGADLHYTIKLPVNPPQPPQQSGAGPTWDFQLRATFWLGLALCATESAPEYTNHCTPNSDANAKFTSTDPNSPYYLGKAPGAAYMELQFYEPGWVPQFDGFGCSATKWCANFTIDSLTEDMNTGQFNNSACDDLTLGGDEPINWAYITKSGQPQAPANPIATNNNPKALVPNLKKVLLMNSGDTLDVWIHDTPAGERVDITDLTTGGTGSMTASKANGFGQLLFRPNGTTCREKPYAFHPLLNTAGTRGIIWGAHTYNVAFSDEIGHFELCNGVRENLGPCTHPGHQDADTGLDADDDYCLNGALYPGAVPIIGCALDDGDFDGTSYQYRWPGSRPDLVPGQDVPTPVAYTVPSTAGQQLERIAFETDLPRIEVGEPGSPTPPCDRTTGANCTIPPPGAQYYPYYVAANTDIGCALEQGGKYLPNVFNDFGGSAPAEYDGLLQVPYPGPGFQPVYRYNDFRRDFMPNPCR